MNTVAGSSEFLYTEKKSRFISRCWQVDSRDALGLILLDSKKHHPDVSLLVYAFIIGDENNEDMGYSDDREPRGTAGRPTYEVLKGSGLRNTLITTLRYFGGTKLGTGGLVRAYTSASKGAIELAEVIEVKSLWQISVELDYASYEQLVGYIAELPGEIVRSEFDSMVHSHIEIEEAALPRLREFIQDTTRGKAEITIVSGNETF